MKDFFKTFFASLLGTITGLGCLVALFFFVIIGAIVASVTGVIGESLGYDNSSSLVELQDNTILKIDVPSLNDVVSDSFIDNIFSSRERTQPIALSQIIYTIEEAKNNPHISGIYLSTSGIQAGLPSLDALRRSLIDFKKSGKFVIAYSDGYSQKDYYLSSIADQILLNPTGMVELMGISSSHLMYKSALDKLGVEMQVFKVGTYKAAVEPYILDHISDPNKEQVSAYISGLWNTIVSGIASARHLDRDSLEAFVNRGEALSEAKRFAEFGLVDSLVYRSDVANIVANRTGVDSPEDLRMVTLSDLYGYLQTNTKEKESDSRIAVLFAEGEITEVQDNAYSSSVETTIGYSLAEDLKDLAEDDDVNAVVLRINSPGGSAFLSEQIWNEVHRLKAKKPVVVSMGDLAASGGYYISAGATKIVAEPTTLTGSIGIFGLMPNATGLAKKVGLNLDVVKTSEFADLMNGLPINPMRAEEKALIQREVERGYKLFLSRVAEGRKMTTAQVDSIAQGRVWLGSKALELGLVDKLGGLDTAIKLAAEIAKLGNDYKVDYGTTTINFFDKLFGSQSTDDFIARLRSVFMTKQEQQILRLINTSSVKFGLQTRLPYEFQPY